MAARLAQLNNPLGSYRQPCAHRLDAALTQCGALEEPEDRAGYRGRYFTTFALFARKPAPLDPA